MRCQDPYGSINGSHGAPLMGTFVLVFVRHLLWLFMTAPRQSSSPRLVCRGKPAV